jgi:hypothetical protein
MKYYSSGVLKHVFTQVTGEHITYYDNGVKHENWFSNMKGKHGTYVQYDVNNRILFTAEYVNNVKVESILYHHDNDTYKETTVYRVLEKIKWENNKMISYVAYDIDGNNYKLADSEYPCIVWAHCMLDNDQPGYVEMISPAHAERKIVPYSCIYSTINNGQVIGIYDRDGAVYEGTAIYLFNKDIIYKLYENVYASEKIYVANSFSSIIESPYIKNCIECNRRFGPVYIECAEWLYQNAVCSTECVKKIHVRAHKLAGCTNKTCWNNKIQACKYGYDYTNDDKDKIISHRYSKHGIDCMGITSLEYRTHRPKHAFISC